MSDPDLDLEGQLEDLPPSAVLVYKVLEYHDDSLTQAEIVEEAHLNPRTTRYALGRLDDVGLIDETTYTRDARQSLYSTVKCE